MSTCEFELRRDDPILGLRTPLLFAHRGGAGEVPESTKKAFRHAVEHGTDVLEVDVRLTRDKKMVVWHGPELDKLRGDDREFTERDIIGDFDWDKFHKSVWVRNPRDKDETPSPEAKDELRLLLLSEFLDFVDELPNGCRIPVNIELKGQSGHADRWTESTYLRDLLDLLDKHSHRKIIIVSMKQGILKSLRSEMKRRPISYPTNVSPLEQIPFGRHMKFHLFSALLSIGHLFAWKKPDIKKRAFETSYALVSDDLVCQVRNQGGSLYVFLTGFTSLAAAIDPNACSDLREPLFKMLDSGVDGIMTDFPEKVGKLMKEWKDDHPWCSAMCTDE